MHKLNIRLPNVERDRKILIEEFKKKIETESFESDESVDELIKLLQVLKELK